MIMTARIPILFSALLWASVMLQPLTGFMLLPNGLNAHAEQSKSQVQVNKILPLFASEDKSSGDKVRASTGIRPSLHPTTINALTGALKLRAQDNSPLKVSEKNQPIDVAMAAAKIAADFLQSRRDTSGDDNMEFEVKEEQTIAGRIVGVVMRLDELESKLNKRVSEVAWISKYEEWASFGILEDSSNDALVQERTKTDPLFCMARAECMLAIFLNTVEAPKLAELGEDVPGGSVVDFIDADRLEVLMGDFQ
jgi:hypothetical protein